MIFIFLEKDMIYQIMMKDYQILRYHLNNYIKKFLMKNIKKIFVGFLECG